MELAQRKLPNKVNELYILPVLLLLVNVTLVLWFYLIREYFQPHQMFVTEYNFNEVEIAAYLTELRLNIILTSTVLLITPLYLKFRKRWVLVSITVAHLVALYLYFYV